MRAKGDTKRAKREGEGGEPEGRERVFQPGTET